MRLLLLLCLPFPRCCVHSLKTPSTPSPLKHPIETVCVVGNTHGNEYTGVWCVKAMEQDLKAMQAKYPSLQLSTLLANPAAHLANRRFLETDLNRQFSIESLYADEPSQLLEAKLAREMDAQIGPKSAETPRIDVCIDLHSTTCNMGTTLIFPEGDPLMAQAAAWIQHRLPPECRVTILVEPLPPREYRPNVGSCAQHDFTIEVGPVPQGVLRHDAVQNTQRAVAALLDFLEQRNRDAEGVAQILLDAYPQRSVQCFHTAKASDAGNAGAMTGRITWPSSPDNPNFPAYIVHESVQDADYQPLHKGAPLFVDLDGTVLPYDGAYGDPVHLMFINEAGYYYSSSGTGIAVCHPGMYDYTTGMVVEEDDPSRTNKAEAVESLSTTTISKSAE